MKYARPRTLTLGLAAMLIAPPAFGQASPPPGQRGQQARPVTGDSVIVQQRLDAMRERVVERRDGIQGQEGGPGDFGRFLFPPELVMQHQRDLALTDQQQAILSATMAKLESDIVGWNWKMASEQQKLTELVQATPVDSIATLAQIDRVLDLERQVKRAHIAALVRIKNTLTADQQYTLRELMGRQPMGPPGGGMRGRMGPPDGGRGRRGGGPGDSPEHH